VFIVFSLAIISIKFSSLINLHCMLLPFPCFPFVVVNYYVGMSAHPTSDEWHSDSEYVNESMGNTGSNEAATFRTLFAPSSSITAQLVTVDVIGILPVALLDIISDYSRRPRIVLFGTSIDSVARPLISGPNGWEGHGGGHGHDRTVDTIADSDACRFIESPATMGIPHINGLCVLCDGTLAMTGMTQSGASARSMESSAVESRMCYYAYSSSSLAVVRKWTRLKHVIDPTPRMFSSMVLDSRAQLWYRLGGRQISRLQEGAQQCDAYNPITQSWSPIADLPIPVNYCSAAYHNNDIYCLACPWIHRAVSLFRYDASTNTWDTDLPAPPHRSWAQTKTVLVATPIGLIALGADEFSRCDIYNVETKTWARLSWDLPRPLQFMEAIMVDHNWLAIVGCPPYGSFKNKFECYLLNIHEKQPRWLTYPSVPLHCVHPRLVIM
jgi:hypothetical protein